MLLEEIYNDIKTSFNSVWSFKERGDTLEVITPFVTTLNDFISVFITKRNDYFVVADGGWVSRGEYDVDLDFEDSCFSKLFYHYESSLKISSTKSIDGSIFYYKKTEDPAMVPSLVMDLGSFISTIVSASAVRFGNEQEKETRRIFYSKAKGFLTSHFPNEVVHFNETLDDLRAIKFNSIINFKNKISLLNFVTGHAPNNFNNSIFKAFYSFQFSYKSIYTDQILSRITLIDNEANGYTPSKVTAHIENLKSIGVTTLDWTEKESIHQAVGF